MHHHSLGICEILARQAKDALRRLNDHVNGIKSALGMLNERALKDLAFEAVRTGMWEDETLWRGIADEAKRLELRCACGRSAFVPTSMLRHLHGDRTFRRVLTPLRCSACGKLPAPVYPLADQHREFCWGSTPGWAIELVRKPGARRVTILAAPPRHARR